MMLYEIKFVFYIFCVVYCPGSESLGQIGEVLLLNIVFTCTHCLIDNLVLDCQASDLLFIQNPMLLPHTKHASRLSHCHTHYRTTCLDPPPPCLKDCHTVIHLCLETHALRLSHCHTHYLFRSQCYHHISNMPQDVTVRNG